MHPIHSHLTPELRTDRNGVTSTRWVKPSSSEAMAQLGVPAPALSALTHTEKLVKNISDRITEHTGKPRSPETMAKWVGNANKRQLSAIQESLDVLEISDGDPAQKREQRVILSILESLGNDPIGDEVVMEMLMIRKAYCGERSIKHFAIETNRELKSYVYGIRSDAPLPLDSAGMISRITAAVRFAYEVNTTCSNERFNPTETYDVRASILAKPVTEKRYRNADLLELVMEKHEQVDAMIELVTTYRTSDPATLRGLMDNPDGAKPLVSGWL